ncbi:MAG: AmmeMemoRadiSam system protein B [Actinomycetota bacterium]
MTGVRAIIVPHDWNAGTLISHAFQLLDETRDWKRVILIGPNHTGAGWSTSSTSLWEWSTPYGRVGGDRLAIRRLMATGLARVEPEVLSREHSVAGLVPVVGYFMPGASLVPVALRSHPRREVVKEFAGSIAALCDEDTVIVASVDFAHRATVSQARRLNRESIRVLWNLDVNGALRLGNDHTDSSAALAVVAEVARLLGATRFELLADTDSASVGSSSDRAVTSYVVGYFRLP